MFLNIFHILCEYANGRFALFTSSYRARVNQIHYWLIETINVRPNEWFCNQPHPVNADNEYIMPIINLLLVSMIVVKLLLIALTHTHTHFQISFRKYKFINEVIYKIEIIYTRFLKMHTLSFSYQSLNAASWDPDDFHLIRGYLQFFIYLIL